VIKLKRIPLFIEREHLKFMFMAALFSGLLAAYILFFEAYAPLIGSIPFWLGILLSFCSLTLAGFGIYIAVELKRRRAAELEIFIPIPRVYKRPPRIH